MRRLAGLATFALATAAPALAQEAGAKLYREPERFITEPAEPAGSPSVSEFIRWLQEKYGEDLTFDGETLRGPATAERCRADIGLPSNMTDAQRNSARKRNGCLVIMEGRRLPLGD
jgi:hypothetical protein